MTARRRHGLHPLRRRVQVTGLVTLDRPWVAARALLDWRADLIAALSGLDRGCLAGSRLSCFWTRARNEG
jgi:hypothetical protein